MPYKQGDLVTLKIPQTLPDGSVLRHPVLIINSSRLGYETYYTGVMMTSSAEKDRYSFLCDNDMFTTPLEKNGCQLRLYLIFGFREEDTANLKSQMKKVYYTTVINQIKEYILNID